MKKNHYLLIALLAMLCCTSVSAKTDIDFSSKYDEGSTNTITAASEWGWYSVGVGDYNIQDADYIYISYEATCSFNLILQDKDYKTAYSVNCSKDNTSASILIKKGEFDKFTYLIIQNHSAGTIKVNSLYADNFPNDGKLSTALYYVVSARLFDDGGIKALYQNGGESINGGNATGTLNKWRTLEPDNEAFQWNLTRQVDDTYVMVNKGTGLNATSPYSWFWNGCVADVKYVDIEEVDKSTLGSWTRSVSDENAKVYKIKMSTGSSDQYFHLNGHSNGAGTDGYTTGWTPDGNGFCEFYIMPVAAPSYSIGDAGYCTFVSPFEIPAGSITSGVTIYDAALDGDKVNLTEASSIPADHPVILACPTATSDNKVSQTFYGFGNSTTTPSYGCLVGTYSKMYAPLGGYVLQRQDGVVAFYNVTEAGKQNVPAYRAYIPASQDGVKQLQIGFGDDETGIATAISATQTSSIYDLSGRRLQAAPQHGIYIMNGKKYLK